jgi:hypothetical protein
LTTRIFVLGGHAKWPLKFECCFYPG